MVSLHVLPSVNPAVTGADFTLSGLVINLLRRLDWVGCLVPNIPHTRNLIVCVWKRRIIRNGRKDQFIIL